MAAAAAAAAQQPRRAQALRSAACNSARPLLQSRKAPARAARAAVQVRAVLADEPNFTKEDLEQLQRPDPMGRYGKFGGKYVPETLISALAELEVQYKEIVATEEYQV